MSPVFIWPVRVYYEDTDAGGVVFYANYLKYMERARTEWLRHLGIGQERLRREQGVIFAVRAASLEYLRPAVLDDLLHVTARVTDRRRASLVIEHEIRRHDGAGTPELLNRGEVKIACLDAGKFTPRPIPALIVDAMTAGDSEQ
ncbi:tol-pal system-associated acyl-CoA thioesterase [Ectothiorhodospira shaposhnikovii]|uniref:tol-pal system-associated acyl-CoA thioesterase n=1 Tax=Ectothiorhodospira shaposhnikovii TaxID=1054 RepID=UPI001EE98B34|nr:tol-pal system-associated acyl-CoA thioesterase [Ectothiorhodospira shaposhnikovii]MCG5513501.1 tol-pal system-associated acyl-CoA thioesterase [Ectothiorhodospira shaposhnikovii]